MRVVALGLALAVLAARPVDAGTMLYTTAGSSDRVYGYCLDKSGALPPQPAVAIDVATKELRRLLVRTAVVDGVEYRTLYVAGIDRVEVYAMTPDGVLIGGADNVATARFTIQPNAKEAKLLSEMVPATQAPTRTSDGGFVFVRSNVPLFRIELFFT